MIFPRSFHTVSPAVLEIFHSLRSNVYQLPYLTLYCYWAHDACLVKTSRTSRTRALTTTTTTSSSTSSSMSSSNLPTLFVSDNSSLSFSGKPLARAESYRFPAIPPNLGAAPKALIRQVSNFQSVDEDTLDDLKVLLNSVVKIFVSSVSPNFISPWTNHSPDTSTGL